MKKEKHSDISSRKKSNQKIIDSYGGTVSATAAQQALDNQSSKKSKKSNE